ncbi:MAG: proline racemase family protein [Segetibacter sp.]
MNILVDNQTMASKKFFCIDAHTWGNPVRLVAGGGPFLKGNNMSEKKTAFFKRI